MIKTSYFQQNLFFYIERNMISLQELCGYIDNLLSSQSFNDYGPNGLQVEGKKEITRVATGVSASLETIKNAVALGVDALIVHHGMFWNKDSLVLTGIKREKIKLLVENNISLLAYHLPLDAHTLYGNNWKVAKDLNWQNLQPFGEYNKMFIGVKGILPKSIDRNELKVMLEGYYGHPAHCALGGKDRIETVALISGGAHRNIQDAIKENIDCYITGSFDEPIWNQAFEEKINFFALGHAATERIGPKALGEHLQDTFGLPCLFIDSNNPF